MTSAGKAAKQTLARFEDVLKDLEKDARTLEKQIERMRDHIKDANRAIDNFEEKMAKEIKAAKSSSK